MEESKVGNGVLILGDVINILDSFPPSLADLIIADPPYFRVLEGQEWDNQWRDKGEYLDWAHTWLLNCRSKIKDTGLVYVFGQLGKRESVWLNFCSLATEVMQFHDMIIWDRVVGYNDRKDSFTPQYEMILALRKREDSVPYFDKDAVRVEYDEETIQRYLKDKRYKDVEAREEHLRKGKYSTNIISVPSLKGASKEKIGHPSQKPLELIKRLVISSSPPGGVVIDPFIGSGTTAEACELLGRKWIGIDREQAYIEMSKRRVGKICGVGS